MAEGRDIPESAAISTIHAVYFCIDPSPLG
jgi:hypothetical protein